jgi:hypothetical protein
MTDGEKAGAAAMLMLYMVLAATWFTVFALAWHHIKKWLT